MPHRPSREAAGSDSRSDPSGAVLPARPEVRGNLGQCSDPSGHSRPNRGSGGSRRSPRRPPTTRPGSAGTPATLATSSTGSETCFPLQTAVMTFLRDPVDRAVSAFYYFRSMGREKLAEEQRVSGLDRCCDLSLDEFLEARTGTLCVCTWETSKRGCFYSPDVPRLALAGDVPIGPRRGDAEPGAGRLRRCYRPVRGVDPALVQHVRLAGPGYRPAREPHLLSPASGGVSPGARDALKELTTLDAELYRLGSDLFADAPARCPTPACPAGPVPDRPDLRGPDPWVRVVRPGAAAGWVLLLDRAGGLA